MTQAKAATVAAALVTAGYKPHVVSTGVAPSENWLILVSSDDGVPVNTLKNFQDAQGITIIASSAVMS